MSTLKCWICTLLAAFFCLAILPRPLLAAEAPALSEGQTNALRELSQDLEQTKDFVVAAHLAPRVATHVLRHGSRVEPDHYLLIVRAGPDQFFVRTYLNLNERELEISWYLRGQRKITTFRFIDDGAKGLLGYFGCEPCRSPLVDLRGKQPQGHTLAFGLYVLVLTKIATSLSIE